jgi:sugar phosphate isomerase/epimerase
MPDGSTPRFSLAHLTLIDCAPPELTYIAATAGYDYVSFRPILLGLPDEPNYSLGSNRQLMTDTRAALAATGVRVLDIELAKIADGVDVAAYAPALEAGAELGATNVVSSIWTDKRDFAIDSLGRLCDLAADFGLTINLEFVTFAAVRTLQEALCMINAVNRPNCGVLIDTLHFSRSRVSADELALVPPSWFHMVHLCDAPAEIPTTNEDLIYTARAARLDPGEGGIDLAAIVRRIPNVPYSLEIPNLAREKAVGAQEHARRCLVQARKFVVELQH